MDIRLFYQGIDGIDIGIENGDLAHGHELETAVLLSLFTDRRAELDDPLPSPDGDRRGFWGDTYADIKGDRSGSRLWLLSREKQLPETLVRAKHYVDEALAWMLEDGVAERIEVSVEYVRQGVMGIQIMIYRPTTQQSTRPIEVFQFDYAWQQQKLAA